ncbi:MULTISPECIES: STAS domain-containing protein [Streptomyces]|uniref:STAS domain-containing protein n=1 Tax=Streptomyces TaxID=1883 RepID=UPI002795AD87|nr:STAS domain-containing protein [Streptomyces canarius]
MTLTGEMDHHTGDTLRQALDASDTPRPRIVVDMHQVTFMDSSGINIFVACHQQVSEAQGWVRIAGAQQPVLRIVELVGIDALITCHPSVEQALRRHLIWLVR